MNQLTTNIALLVLRLGAGGFMLTHGYGKMGKVISGEFAFADPIGLGQEASLILAALAEFLGAILVMVGLGTRVAALSLVGTMLVAGLIVHASDPWGKKEFALLYAVGFTAIMIAGAGRYSLDHLIAGKLKNRKKK